MQSTKKFRQVNMSFTVGGDGRGEFKYDIESALAVTCSYTAIMTVRALSDPEQLKAVPDGCHIYAICTRPRLQLTATDRLSEENGVSTFAFTISTADGKINVRIERQISARPGVELEIADGGANAMFLSADGQLLAGVPAAMLLADSLPDPLDKTRPTEIDREMLDMSVQYVGQAYGKDGSRAAIDRLASHETLQKILGELNDRTPNQQAWIALFRFDGHAAASSFGPWKGLVGLDESIANMAAAQAISLPGDQLTTLAEGSLIRYFRPAFNDRYKDTFPSEGHSSYRIPYNLDISAIGFDFETTNIGVRFRSDNVSPQWWHSGLFAISDPSVRRTFMDIFNRPPAFLYPLFDDTPSSLQRPKW
jgi:hypothetical protein